MSDCSTEAFKPKKRHIGIVLRLEINDPNDNMSNTTEIEINEHRFVSEQRYQQLEQVAKSLFVFARRQVTTCIYPTPVVHERQLIELMDLRQQAEALGVSLDD